MRSAFSLVVFAIFLAITSTAETTTPIRNIADPVHHPYQVTAYRLDCTDPGDCQIIFPAISTNETLVLHASCTFAIAADGSVTNVGLTNQSFDAENVLPTFAYGTFGSTNYGINADTYLFYAKGDIPNMHVFSTVEPVQFLKCTLTGYYY